MITRVRRMHDKIAGFTPAGEAYLANADWKVDNSAARRKSRRGRAVGPRRARGRIYYFAAFWLALAVSLLNSPDG